MRRSFASPKPRPWSAPISKDRNITFEHGGAALVDEILEGPPDRHLVFLHGWGANRDSLRGIAVLFQSTHTIHLLDLPGFGSAPPPPSTWSTIEYTNLVEEYLSGCLNGFAILIGHSFGARVALRLAARRPPWLRGLVLMAAPGLPNETWSKTRVRGKAIRALRSLLRAAQGITGPGPLEWHTRKYGSKDYLAAGELRPVLVRTVNENLSDCARAVACPVLLLWGTEDTETPMWLAHRFQQLMNGRSTLETLPHKDHYLYTGTGAHLCAYKIRTWLQAVDARG